MSITNLSKQNWDLSKKRIEKGSRTDSAAPNPISVLIVESLGISLIYYYYTRLLCLNFLLNHINEAIKTIL